MFINFSNHPSSKWSAEQKNAALKYGEIVDIQYPNVIPQARKKEIIDLADEFIEKIVKCNPQCVMCQGEFSLTYQVVSKLKEKDILVVAACSERKVKELLEDDKLIKQVEFEFVQFREY